MRLCVLGNGSLFLGFDPKARTREIFWPVVGLANHVGDGADNACLIWYEGAFYQLGGPSWHTQARYGKGMSFDWVFRHKRLPLSVDMSDCVDPYRPVWARTVKVAFRPAAKVGLYFRQHYHLGENTVGECGFYDVSAGRLYHYKGNIWVAVAVILGDKVDGGHLLHKTDVAVAKMRDGGVKLVPQTGGIQGRPIEHGLIESIYSVRREAQGEPTLSTLQATYFAAFGSTRQEADFGLDRALESGFEGIRTRSAKYWAGKLGCDRPRCFYTTSVKVVVSHCDSGGGILASCDTGIMGDFRDHYRYVWPRDAAMCASALLRCGLPEYARRYLAFCSKTLSEHGCFWQRYRADGTRGSGWHTPDLPRGELPVQADETALSLITVVEYLEHTRDFDFVHDIYHTFVAKAARFLQSYRTQGGLLVRPSFDLWEERRGIFTFTQAVSAAALMGSAKLAWMLHQGDYTGFCEAGCELLEGLYSQLSNEELGFCRGLTVPDLTQDWTEDASLFMVPVMLDKIEQWCRKAPAPVFARTIGPLAKRLKSRSAISWRRLKQALMVYAGPEPSGIARYKGDWYWRPEGSHGLPGNPWLVTTAWYLISGYQLRLLDKAEITAWLSWFRKHSLESGILPEQIDGFTQEPRSVAPLTWSHAAYIDLVNLIQAKRWENTKPEGPKIRRKRRNSAIQGEYRPE
ncbi:MAG: glycoside hydrolase family 15 protein [Bacillota bacterium]